MTSYLPRYFRYLIGGLTVLFIANGIAYWFYAGLLSQASAASSDLTLCQSLKSQIEKLNEQLPVATSGPQQDNTSVANVREMLQATDIKESSIDNLSFRGRTAIAKTSFERIDVSIAMTKIALSDLLRFVWEYQQHPTAPICSQMELSHVADSEAGQIALWNANLTLTTITKTVAP